MNTRRENATEEYLDQGYDVSRWLKMFYLLADTEVTANLYCNFAYLYWEGCAHLQYIYTATSGSPSNWIPP